MCVILRALESLYLQVMIRYGKYSNAALALNFGFTLSSNIYDQVTSYGKINVQISKKAYLCTAML